MNIGIIGCRSRNTEKDYQLVEKAFINLYEQIIFSNDANWVDNIVSGGCPKGGDRFAEIISTKYGIPIVIHEARWGLYGMYAGFKRNTLIARDSDILIACISPDRKGGTEDTIRKYLGLGKNKLILV